MSDLSGYLGVFRAQVPEDRRKVVKRNRQALSCVPCRQKKLKCDRQQPCAACVKRGDTTSCDFGPMPPDPPLRRTKEKTKTEAQARLQKLEEMVNNLIQTRSDTVATSDVQEKIKNLDITNPTVAKLRNSTGYYLSSQDTEASFVGPTHWIAILEGINDLKDYLDPDSGLGSNSPETTNNSSTGDTFAESHVANPGGPRTAAVQHDLIIGSYEAVTIDSALAALPSRSVVDNLLTLYFTNRWFASPILHSGKFQRDYLKFRENPHETSLIFVSLIFSVLTVACGIVNASGKAGPWPASALNPRKYMHMAGGAIVSGQYLKAQPYAIEALVLLCHSKFLRTVDSEPSLWALAGLTVRLAQKMGMHRDPSRLSRTISPFNAEMRRRIWFHCETFDLLMSFQLGMPPIINENECDVGHPRNLLATDFDEDTAELPPDRPDTDDSPMLFVTYKSRVIRIFRRVIRHALSTKQPPYSETLALDSELRQLHASIPSKLRIIPINEIPFNETATDIMKRFMLAMLHHKSIAVLHRNFLTYAKEDSTYLQSREAAISSSLIMLDLHEEFERGTSPGGRMYEERWIMSSLTMHDFLMCAMIICLDLAELPQPSPEIREKKILSLKTSYRIWNSKRSFSRDADHAANVIAAMLTKINAQNMSANGHTNGKSQQPGSRNTLMAQTGNPSTNNSGSLLGTTQHMAQRQSLDVSSIPVGKSQNQQASDSLQTDQREGTFGTGAAPTSMHQVINSNDTMDAHVHDLPHQTMSAYSNSNQTSTTFDDSPPFTDESFEFMDLDSLDDMLNPDNIDWNLVDQYLRDRGGGGGSGSGESSSGSDEFAVPATFIPAPGAALRRATQTQPQPQSQPPLGAATATALTAAGSKPWPYGGVGVSVGVSDGGNGAGDDDHFQFRLSPEYANGVA